MNVHSIFQVTMIKDCCQNIWRKMSLRQQHQRFLGFPRESQAYLRSGAGQGSRLGQGSRQALTRSVRIVGKNCKIIFPWTYIAYIQERSFEHGNPSLSVPGSENMPSNTESAVQRELVCEKHSSRSRLLYQGGIRLMSGGRVWMSF